MISQQKNHITQGNLVDMQQGLRAGLEVIGSELKMAGYDPRAGFTGGPMILVADTADLQFEIDRNGDGDLDSGEAIRFALTNDANGDGIADGTPCDLGRGLDGGALQPLAENIDALNFVYFDSNGDVLPTPVADRSAIGSIQVTVVARSGAVLPGFFKRQPDNKIYHNRQGDVVLPARNDGFHRLEIMHEFKGRNLLLN
jgi:type IV pilus assembly protein PilW